MRDLSTLSHHPVLEDIVDVICNKTQNQDRKFFRVELAYFFAKMASSMRAVINTKDRGAIPVNIYALCLATSGFGKGYSVNIIEELFMEGFRIKFIENTMGLLADQNLLSIANHRAAFKQTDPNQEYESLNREYTSAGPYPYTFDSGTVPAVKQLRQKLLLANAGAINLQIDEVGSNLLANAEIMSTFLELYDKGLTKAKLTKNTADNSRGVSIDGPTPANMLLFGTPSKLLDGGSIEDMFFEFLQTGYSRRFLFGIGRQQRSSEKLTPKEIYDRLTSPSSSQRITHYKSVFANLADPLNHKYSIDVPDDVAIELIEYKVHNEQIADKMSENRELEAAELNHRYFKALKLAGTFAFIERSPVITMDTLYHAIALVEDSGKDFVELMNREKAYMKLARHIAGSETELTHADLTEALPYYKTGNAARQEIMTLAQAWGYKNNIMLQKSFVDGIEFFSGKALKETSLNEMMFAYSTDFAQDYVPEKQPFDKLWKLTSAPGYHWTNHYFTDNHRRGENVIEGFNMVVLDIDGTASRDLVHEVLRDYTFMTYTTKRHKENGTGPDRFRVVLPVKYHLEFNKEDYQQFMNNLMEWLPFECDEGANQRERKWLSNSGGEHHYHMAGNLLDPVRFIPRTSKNEGHVRQMQELQDLGSLERWFAENIAKGNRNNNMVRYALALADGGMGYVEIEKRVLQFNKQLETPLPETEITSTILKTVARKLVERDGTS